MGETENLMNSIWFGEKTTLSKTEIKERILKSVEEPLKMELIPSLLSIWTGEKVPAEYTTIMSASNYKDFIYYIDELSSENCEKGQKYFYGYKL